MASRRSDPRSTSDRLQALQELLPELIEEQPDSPRLLGFLRREVRGLFADVTDVEERNQCLRAFAEIGLELGVPAVVVRDALDRAGEDDAP